MRDVVKTALTVVATAALVSVMLPLGATAAGSLVTLADPQTDVKARVDAGELRVGDGSGALDVTGDVRAMPPGRRITRGFSMRVFSGNSVLSTSGTYTVPTGKRFIVTRITGYFEVPDGQAPVAIQLQDTSVAPLEGNASAGGTAHFLPFESYEMISQGRRFYSYVENPYFSVEAGETLTLAGGRTGSTGDGYGQLWVIGFLVPA